MALCDKLGIDYEDENTLLDDTSIVLLDNNVNAIVNSVIS